MKKADIVIGIILILLSLFFLKEALNFPESHTGLNPGTFPIIAFCGIIFLSIVLIVRALLKEKPKVLKFTKKEFKVLILSVVSLILFVVSINYIGFLYASTILLFLISLIAGVKPWFKAIIFSFIVSFLMYYLFGKVFLVIFPKPIWPLPYPF
ncbi:MAG TPA: tripartite tricarboxylate transporter TctB family protein [Dictyoglomaceae bacterium]|nr:tripartite tricarboxylate transporter TctB family protein [Dictyoglomaceae bacterium]